MDEVAVAHTTGMIVERLLRCDSWSRVPAASWYSYSPAYPGSGWKRIFNLQMVSWMSPDDLGFRDATEALDSQLERLHAANPYSRHDTLSPIRRE
jgi:hypothetical protein